MATQWEIFTTGDFHRTMKKKEKQVYIVKFYLGEGITITTALVEFKTPVALENGYSNLEIHSVGLDALREIKETNMGINDWAYDLELLLAFPPGLFKTYTILDSFEMELNFDE